MKGFALCAVFLVATSVVADAQTRVSRNQRGLAAQYSELKRVESCRWREVVQTPLYAVPHVGRFARFLTWDCQIHAAQVATAARRAFERRHMRVAFDRGSRVYASNRSVVRVANSGSTAWYPSGFR